MGITLVCIGLEPALIETPKLWLEQGDSFMPPLHPIYAGLLGLSLFIIAVLIVLGIGFSGGHWEYFFIISDGENFIGGVIFRHIILFPWILLIFLVIKAKLRGS